MLVMEAMSTPHPSASCTQVFYEEDVFSNKTVLKKLESSRSTHYKPTSYDVLCGRGQMNIIHPGNRKLRACVGLYLDRYLNAKKRQTKTRLVDKLVNMVRESGGRFLRKVSGHSYGWIDIGYKHAFEKVSHVFRDARAERDKNEDQDASTNNKGLVIKRSNRAIRAGRTRSDPPSFFYVDPTALMLQHCYDQQHEPEQHMLRRQYRFTELDNFSLRQQPQPPINRYMQHIATDLRQHCRSPQPDPIISSENNRTINELFVKPRPCYDDHPSFTSSVVANDSNFCNGHDFSTKKPQSSRGYQPTTSDVLCGRGQTNASHDGNQRFRASIGLHLDSYLAAKNRLGKTMLVAEIVKRVRESGGKFLKKDRKSGEWFDIADKQACKKVGHALRDAHAERIRNRDAYGKQSQISPRTTATTAVNATQNPIESAPKDDPSVLSMLLKQPLISISCSLPSCIHGCRNCLDEMGPLLSREDCLSPFGSFCAITTQEGGADSWTHRIPSFDELF